MAEQPSSPINLARPDITAADRAAVDLVLQSPSLSRGPELAAFEADIASHCGSQFAVGLSSGTAALHLALLTSGCDQDTTILTTAFSVPASINAALQTGARVRLVDISSVTRSIDTSALERQARPGAVVLWVHAFGQMADMAEVRRICDDSQMILIEDSCEALGSTYAGRHAGTFGRCGTFGFYPNKQITCGEGGMLITDCPEVADRVRSLSNHGRRMDGRWLDQDGIGFNYRMSEIQAALGRSQLARIGQIKAMRTRLHRWYVDALEELPGIVLGRDIPAANTCWFVMVIHMPDGSTREQRDRICDHLATAGIQTGRYFAPLHRQPALSSVDLGDRNLPVTDSLADRAIALPFHHSVSLADVQRVAAALTDVWPGIGR